jgi:hypothetical protein
MSAMHRLAAAAFLLAAIASAAGCAELPPNVPSAGALDARRLEGGWHVLATNFPMWLDGKKTDPVFIYHLQEEDGDSVVLDDTVAYTESGKKETILGTDTQDPRAPSHFTWRGKGLLAAFTSDWVIAKTAPDGRWMVLYFTKTIATPEGVDVIARAPAMSREERAEVERALAADPFLSQKSRGLVWLRGPEAK